MFSSRFRQFQKFGNSEIFLKRDEKIFRLGLDSLQIQFFLKRDVKNFRLALVKYVPFCVIRDEKPKPRRRGRESRGNVHDPNKHPVSKNGYLWLSFVNDYL